MATKKEKTPAKPSTKTSKSSSTKKSSSTSDTAVKLKKRDKVPVRTDEFSDCSNDVVIVNIKQRAMLTVKETDLDKYLLTGWLVKELMSDSQQQKWEQRTM